MSDFSKGLHEIDVDCRARWSEWGQVTYAPGAVLGPRLQANHQFVFLHEGTLDLHLDDSEYRFAAPSVFLLTPGRREFFRFDRRGPTRHSWTHFGLDDSPGASALKAVAAPASVRLDGAIVALLDLALAAESVSEPERAVYRRRLCDAVLALFLAGSDVRTQASPSIPRPVALAQRFIQTEWRRTLTLEDIARAAFVSGPHLVRLFREHTGETPVRALWRCRLRHARNLLLHSGLRVSEIADATGFSTPAHFSRAFRQQYGQSPSQLRRSVWRSDLIGKEPSRP